MRNVMLACLSATAVALSVVPVSAQTPSYETCHALAQQRGSGHTAGMRTHEAFIRSCLAGRVPIRGVPSQAAGTGPYQGLANYDSCHALAEQRGAGHEAGRRAHEAFMSSCMAGRVPFQAPVATAPGPGPFAQAANYDTCHALAERRGAGHTAGMRAHEAFMRACLAGRVPF
jgi:hypothetical protein